MKPTDEQIKEFWERCGFEQAAYGDGQFYNYPDGGSARLPELDLNNLFKYAVPYINKHYGYAVCLEQVPGSLDWYCQLVMPNCSVAKTYRLSPKDPALALFWAIYEVMK